jgi:hypothetical protein
MLRSLPAGYHLTSGPQLAIHWQWPSSSKSKSDSSYVSTDGQSASLSWCQAPISGSRSNICYCQTVAGLLLWGNLSDERTGLSFQITAGLRPRRHSRALVPRDSWPYFTVSYSRLPEPAGQGPRIYIPQEQGGPAIHPGIGFPFRRLLRFTGLRWRYRNPPLHGPLNPLQFWVWVSLILRPTVSRPVYLAIDSCSFVDVGRSLWRQDGSVVYQSHSQQ